MDGLVFDPGNGTFPDYPLGRFLPPLPEGILSAWLKENIPRGEWVLDPLGSTPQAALEAARSGYRVLVACNNPVLALMLEVLARAPQREEFQTLIAQLADSRRAEERLEVHLESLYRTICPSCQQPIQAEGYIWKKGAGEPAARIVDCPHCGTRGEFPLEEQDRVSLQSCGSLAMTRSRALVRNGIQNAAENPVIREVMDSYPDRAFYVLFNLINRIEALPVSVDQRRLLQALLLSACDTASMLWPHPVLKTRPRLITPPAEYIEINLWRAFQSAVSLWSAAPEPIAFSLYPELPSARLGGICLFPGRYPAIGQLAGEIDPRAALAIIPYPNQAFWSYSAVWSGWIWGKGAAHSLQGVLERQRFDSRWIGAVLTSAFYSLPKDIPVFAQLPEATPGLLTACLAAGLSAGLRLEGVAYEQEADLAQICWQSGYSSGDAIPSSVSHLYRDAMRDALMVRSEPATYLQLAGASLERLIDRDVLPMGKPGFYEEILIRIQQAQKENFEDSAFLKVYGSRAADSQGAWWLKRNEPSLFSLADRVEEEILGLLKGKAGFNALALQETLNRQFRGFLTPPPSLVEAILASYCSKQPEQPGILAADAQKLPQNFEPEVVEMNDLVNELGAKLGFRTEKGDHFTWRAGEKLVYGVFITCDGRISRWVDEFGKEPISNIILCPEVRMDLIFFKIGHDPRLLEALGSWRLISFEQLRRIAANKDPLWAFRDAMSDPGKMPDGKAAQISFLP